MAQNREGIPSSGVCSFFVAVTLVFRSRVTVVRVSRIQQNTSGGMDPCLWFSGLSFWWPWGVGVTGISGFESSLIT